MQRTTVSLTVVLVVVTLVLPNPVAGSDEGPTPEECAEWIRQGWSVPPECIVFGDDSEPPDEPAPPADEPDPGPSEGPPDGDDPGPSSVDPAPDSDGATAGGTFDVAGMFYGDRGALVPGPALSQVVDCPEANLLSIDYDEEAESNPLKCKGVKGAWDLGVQALAAFEKRFPNATPLQTEFGKALTRATMMAALEGKDGKPLFPTVRASMDLLKGFIDKRIVYAPSGESPVPMAERFLGILMALDVEIWEDEQRFITDGSP